MNLAEEDEQSLFTLFTFSSGPSGSFYYLGHYKNRN